MNANDLIVTYLNDNIKNKNINFIQDINTNFIKN